MPVLSIDGRRATVPEGATVLDAARLAGIDIPTMCHLDGLPPGASCLVCVVRVKGSGRLLPSCATRAEEGMEVESETPEVLAARRTALELLLADHLGECFAPCQRVCPLDLDIPRLARQVRAGDLAAAAADLRRAVPFPGVLGRVCPARCEGGCRRRTADDPVSVRNLERHVADRDRAAGNPGLPEPAPPTGRRVAVVGGGPAGLAAAYFLALAGHEVEVLERAEKAGGRLRHAFDREVLPEEVLDGELAVLGRLGVAVRCGVEVGPGELGSLVADRDAVVLAVSGLADLRDSPGVFTAGDAGRRIDDPVRAMASGRDAAIAADAHLAGRAAPEPRRPFTTTVGRLTGPELALYLRSAGDREPAGRPGEATRDLAPEEAAGEARRCLLCACRATETCLLRRHGERLGADPKRFAVKRRLFEQDLDHPIVVYEPGKCIACGICVRLTEEMGEELGLAFIGRGFDVRVGVPFDAPLREALRRSAERCILCCPTGALARKDEEPA